MAWVHEMGGDVRYDYDGRYVRPVAEPPGPSWLRALLGLDFLSDVIEVGCDGLLDSADVSPLAGLPDLRTLTLSHTRVSDLTPLTKLNNLEYLTLNKTSISDLTPLADLGGVTFFLYFQLFDIAALRFVSLRTKGKAAMLAVA